MYKIYRSKATRYRRRKRAALSIAALFSSSSENKEDNALPLNTTNIVPVHNDETINLKNTSLQNENNELLGNNTNSSMGTSYESSISSVDASDENSPLQSNESLEVSIAIWAIRHSITHSALNDLFFT